MPPIVWTAALESGNRAIDLQHQELVDIINELEVALKGDDAQSEAAQAMQRLDAYVLFHFQTEERLMGDPRVSKAHVQEHVAEHRAFCDEVSRVWGRLAEGAVCGEQVLAWLQRWLADHVARTDRALVRAVGAR